MIATSPVRDTSHPMTRGSDEGRKISEMTLVSRTIIRSAPNARRHRARESLDLRFHRHPARQPAEPFRCAAVGPSGREHWADPQRTRAGEINHEHGGRGVYLLDPSGHYRELITQPYL